MSSSSFLIVACFMSLCIFVHLRVPYSRSIRSLILKRKVNSALWLIFISFVNLQAKINTLGFEQSCNEKGPLEIRGRKLPRSTLIPSHLKFGRIFRNKKNFFETNFYCHSAWPLARLLADFVRPLLMLAKSPLTHLTLNRWASGDQRVTISTFYYFLAYLSPFCSPISLALCNNS